MTTSRTTAAPIPGLKGVAVTSTSIGDVRGAEGFYHYRQYSAPDVAAKRTFEDAWQLLIDGSLPATPADAEAFRRRAALERRLPEDVAAALPRIAGAVGPAGVLQGLRTALSLYGSIRGFRPVWDLDGEGCRRDLNSICAATPVLAAALHRLACGLEPIDPDPDLGHAADYLRMLTGTVPTAEHARALERYLVLTMDHGFNSSTFTARVVASTGADAAAAVVGALGALSGPLHGGAPSRALDLLDSIGSAASAETYVRGLLAQGERIMGFGHAVYRTEDPRSKMLRDVAKGLGGELAELAVEVEDVVLSVLAETRPERPLRTNVEYYAGVVMDACGVPRHMFTPTFAVSRMVGWSAHIAEQTAERTLIRPSALYTGPTPPVPVPVAA